MTEPIGYIIGFACGVLIFVVVGKVRLWLQSRSEELRRESRQQGVEQEVEYDTLYGAKDIVRAPWDGGVFKLLVDDGAVVRKGDVVLIFESLKMEFEIKAPADGYVKFYQLAKSVCPKDTPLFAVMF